MRLVEAEVVSNARNKIHQTWPKPFSQALHSSTEIGKKAWLFAKLQPGRARKRINAT